MVIPSERIGIRFFLYFVFKPVEKFLVLFVSVFRLCSVLAPNRSVGIRQLNLANEEVVPEAGGAVLELGDGLGGLGHCLAAGLKVVLALCAVTDEAVRGVIVRVKLDRVGGGLIAVLVDKACLLVLCREVGADVVGLGHSRATLL